MRKKTGAGWDRARGVIDMDDEWWKKAKAVSSDTILFCVVPIRQYIRVIYFRLPPFRIFQVAASLKKTITK